MPRQSDAFFRIGLPMLLLVTGGSLFLSKLLQGKFDIKAREKLKLMTLYCTTFSG